MMRLVFAAVHSYWKIGEAIIKQGKKLIQKILYYIVAISDMSDFTQSVIFEECGVTA